MRKMMLAALAAVTLAGCGDIALRPTDSRRAVALAPYQRTVQPWGAIVIAEGQVFHPAIADGVPAWCTTNATFFMPGDARALCMIEPAGGAQAEGWFRSAYSARSYSGSRLAVDVPYRVVTGPALPPR